MRNLWGKMSPPRLLDWFLCSGPEEPRPTSAGGISEAPRHCSFADNLSYWHSPFAGLSGSTTSSVRGGALGAPVTIRGFAQPVWSLLMKLKPRHRCAGPRVIMRNWRSFWFAGVSAAFILIFFQVTAARAATLNVPADYATIQAAIDAAANGGFVLVEPTTRIQISRAKRPPSKGPAGGARPPPRPSALPPPFICGNYRCQ